MAISRFPMNHRNWYWYLVFFANTVLPWSLCFAKLAHDKPIFSTPNPFWIPLSLFVLSMMMVLIYIWASLREHRACSKLLRERVRVHFIGFAVGISCTWALLFISFATVCANLFLFQNQDGTAKMAITYSMVSISLILGLISNVFLNMFEFRIGFDVFRHRYSKTLMIEIMESINSRKRANKRNIG